MKGWLLPFRCILFPCTSSEPGDSDNVSECDYNIEKKPLQAHLRFLADLSAFFKNQSQKKPERKKIQADQTIDMKSTETVIPWTGMKQAKKAAGQIFCCKNENCIDRSPEQNTQLFQIMGNNRDQGSQSINGEHQKGSLSHQSFVIGGCKGMDTGEKDFHAPSDYPAAEKIFRNIF